jgi:hypothetical protein
MKKQLLIISLLAASLTGIAQTAVNFTCNDCSSVPHDLFSELDAGKVIVLDFIMPCGSCISPSISAYNIVQSYASSNPGMVKFYLSDDLGTTPCNTLNSWASTNSISPDAVFSNTSVVESAYGTGGMPKIVVVGGPNHTVYFNQYGTAANNPNAITNAINLALLATGIQSATNNNFNLNVIPSSKSVQVMYSLNEPADVTLNLLNELGQVVNKKESGRQAAGKYDAQFDLNETAGVYFIRVSTEHNSQTIKFTVTK